MPVATEGISSGAGFRVLAAYMRSHVGLRAEYNLIGASLHDIRRYGYIHRTAAALRLKAPWYRERRGRFDAYFDLGSGRQLVAWRDGAIDRRWDFALGTGIRFDGILASGRFIGYGFGVIAITAPATPTPTATRSTTPRDSGRDVALYLAFEAVL